jgi:hypothetical protein
MLEYNCFSSLAALSVLADMPSLKSLYLGHNRIATIEQPGGTTPDKAVMSLRFHPRLSYVDLSYNGIDDWAFIDRLQQAFPGLTGLRVAHNPLYEGGNGRAAMGVEDSYMLTLARLENLKTLNFSHVRPPPPFPPDCRIFHENPVSMCFNGEVSCQPDGFEEKNGACRSNHMTAKWQRCIISPASLEKSKPPPRSRQTKRRSLAGIRVMSSFVPVCVYMRAVCLFSDSLIIFFHFFYSLIWLILESGLPYCFLSVLVYGPPVIKRRRALHVDLNSLEARLVVFTFLGPAASSPPSSTSSLVTTTLVGAASTSAAKSTAAIKISKRLPRSFDIYRLKAIVGRLFGLAPAHTKLVLETDEWDPVERDEDDSEDYDDHDYDDYDDNDGVDDDVNVDEDANSRLEGNEEKSNRPNNTGDGDGAGAGEHSKNKTQGPMSSLASSTPAEQEQDRKTTWRSRRKEKWKRREIELVDGTREVGFWVEGKEARVRVETC